MYMRGLLQGIGICRCGGWLGKSDHPSRTPPPGHATKKGRLGRLDVSRRGRCMGGFDFFFFRKAPVLLLKLSADGLEPTRFSRISSLT